jgi:hypothetical protein
VLVSQSKAQVEIYLRKKDGAWLFNSWKGLKATANLKSIRIKLPLAEIYKGVEF